MPGVTRMLKYCKMGLSCCYALYASTCKLKRNITDVMFSLERKCNLCKLTVIKIVL